MIARVWFGRTRPEALEAYTAYLKQTGVHDLAGTEGNRGVYLLRRAVDGAVEFGVVSLWDSIEDVRRFAGPDARRAVYYPDDDRYLLERTPDVAHFDVVAGPDAGRGALTTRGRSRPTST
jgi:heme-degrading monooxygenase HmoA